MAAIPSVILRWYERAQLDYETRYIALYASYNAWYSALLGVTSNRRAIEMLKQRAVIWEECLADFCAPDLKRLLRSAYEQTLLHPMTTYSSWSGQLRSSRDWASMIELWYAVRCSLVHGLEVPSIFTQIAYSSLNIFMTELLDRAEKISERGGDALAGDMERFYHVKTLY